MENIPFIMHVVEDTSLDITLHYADRYCNEQRKSRALIVTTCVQVATICIVPRKH